MLPPNMWHQVASAGQFPPLVPETTIMMLDKTGECGNPKTIVLSKYGITTPSYNHLFLEVDQPQTFNVTLLKTVSIIHVH